MPELPEVETIRRFLAREVTGAKVVWLQLHLKKALRNSTSADLTQGLVGRRIVGFSRRGKHLLLTFDSGAKLVIHLRMTGQLLLVPAQTPLQKHTTLVIGLHGERELHLVDQRKFATLDYLPQGREEDIPALVKSGLEPLEAEFTWEVLQEMLHKRTTKLKTFLLDQRFIAGLGNIYADESLFRSGLHPERPCNTLSEEEVKALHNAIIETLEASLLVGGTSVRNYVNAQGTKGSFQEQLQVYGREKQPCPRCQEAIHRIKLGGRSSFFCSNCQR